MPTPLPIKKNSKNKKNPYKKYVTPLFPKPKKMMNLKMNMMITLMICDQIKKKTYLKVLRKNNLILELFYLNNY